MGIRTTIRNKRAKAHSAVSDWLKPKILSIDKRHRIVARIRLANIWATKYPKKTSACVISFLLIIFVLNIVVTGAQLESNEPKLSEIALVEPIFDGFRRIQANKEVQRSRIADLARQGKELRHGIDSLMSIPSKSHTDSIEIVARYKQLEQIANTLKIKYDDKN